MGAAIECFDQAGALVMPRTRFAPVKTTSDLLALRSDAYKVTADWRLVLEESRQGQPPVLELDPTWYKLLTEFDRLFPVGPPSLLRCQLMSSTGPVRFEAGVVCEGQVHFDNPSTAIKTVTAGTYRQTRVNL
jgi:hypothetical protein